jgi:hypothetical protein
LFCSTNNSQSAELFRTEICRNFTKLGYCIYAKKCLYAHGEENLNQRERIESYKTSPCPDPAVYRVNVASDSPANASSSAKLGKRNGHGNNHSKPSQLDSPHSDKSMPYCSYGLRCNFVHPGKYLFVVFI